jgi:hypothetical protein
MIGIGTPRSQRRMPRPIVGLLFKMSIENQPRRLPEVPVGAKNDRRSKIRGNKRNSTPIVKRAGQMPCAGWVSFPAVRRAPSRTWGHSTIRATAPIKTFVTTGNTAAPAA